MDVASRVVFKLPSVKALQQHAAETAAQRDELLDRNEELYSQRDALERERDELAAHGRRLNQEIGEALGREQLLRAERERILADRDALESERAELRGHCERLDRQMAERLEGERRLRAELGALRRLHQEFVERATRLIGADRLLEEMRQDWDGRARQNAFHYTNTGRSDWDEAEYAATGEDNVNQYISTDLGNICQGADPASMRILEIGCGAGRMTKALAKLFGEVHAVDISAEMIRIAKDRLAGVSNAFFYQNNGMDLAALPSGHVDFALSFIVFQHIPSKDVIEGYVKEVHRVLKPGRLFKFQVQGASMADVPPLSTWLGVSYTRHEMEELAARHGFELRHAHGEGTQDFWLWFFKQ